MSAAARKQILSRARAANGGASSEKAAAEDWLRLARDYRRSGRLRREEVVSLFEDRLHDYGAKTAHATHDEARECVASMLRARNRQRLLVPSGIGVDLPDGFTFTSDGPTDGAGLTAHEMDGFDGVITESTLAIAETGTIVLQNVAGQGRRALTLVPDYHLCVVRERDVVETVPEAMARLQSTARLLITFVSGPSATADIEMTRIQGVHGPRVLDVMIVSDSTGPEPPIRHAPQAS
jgi:L-lactate dehydrogenase complex protein LldG